ncbi:DUF4367 domain-containing protein [Paenibacillus alkalitolerans]|uniref:DUF4367 domain-containing protein n=1 Tax=Paenibacillus alkalitolerans TaxID=2799335 RepID=UPI0018F529A3|nr:DUF4367 domain-containing protein [Paenibacillus alkalitolerans]
MNKADFDALFDEAFDSAVQNKYVNTPDPEPSWQKVRAKLAKRRRAAMLRRRFQLVATVAVSMLIGATLFSGAQPIQAFNPFFQYMKEIPGDVVQMFFGSTDAPSDAEAKTPPPPPTGDLTMTAYSLDETKNLFPEMPEVTYIPSGYTFTDAELLTYETGLPYHQASLSFIDTEGNILIVLFIQLNGNTSVGTQMNTKEGSVKEIQVKGSGTGYLSYDGNRYRKLEYMKQDLFVRVAGGISEEEIMRIAEGLK